MNTVIKVENLGKQYRLGEVGTGTLSHDLNRWWAYVRGKEDPFAKIGESNDRTTKGNSEYVWALENINFEVQAGEVLGIIGRNGAGKSTLLKILSKVTKPTNGRILTRGRIASLLEVGTGFHPEMTGRENIFLNGAIMGMTRAEIRRKFDEIVDFAGVERYIDTPVKRYSSGMYVRLAFAVAAHLEPEILIVDEVLAVGDAEFQRKCLGKMKDVSVNDGRTVLFVSHQMGSIAQLCNTSILLSKGRLIKTGPTGELIDYYLEHGSPRLEKVERKEDFPGNHFKEIFMADDNLKPKNSFRFNDRISVKLTVCLPDFNNALELAMRLIDKNKRSVFTIHEKLEPFSSNGKDMEIVVAIPENFLTPGRYSWTMCINHPGTLLYDVNEDILPFTIIETGSEFSRYEGADYGSIFANYTIHKI